MQIGKVFDLSKSYSILILVNIKIIMTFLNLDNFIRIWTDHKKRVKKK
jgi:hypothetical protein